MRPNQTNRLVLAVKESTTLEFGLAAHVDAQLAQHRLIRRRDDHAKEGITAAQLLQARKDAGGRLARGEVIESAMSVSSVWRRGFLLPRKCVLSLLMGSIASSLITSSSRSTPETCLRAFMISELAAPRRVEVLPVTTESSGMTMAPTGPPVSCSLVRAAERAGE